MPDLSLSTMDVGESHRGTCLEMPTAQCGEECGNRLTRCIQGMLSVPQKPSKKCQKAV